MFMPNELLSMIKCSLNNDGHFAKDAILLPCGSNACKQCILDHKLIRDVQCYSCKSSHKLDELKRLPNNPTIGILIEKVFLKDLLKSMKQSFDDILEQINEFKLSDTIRVNIEFVEYEIDIRIESLKIQLDKIGESLRAKLCALKDHTNSIVNKKLDSIRDQIKRIRTNFSLDYDSMNEYQMKLNEFKTEINGLSCLVPKITFEFSDGLLEESIVGKLVQRYPYKYEQIRSFKTHKIQAKFLSCMSLSHADDENVFLIDSMENTLKQVDFSGRLIKTLEIPSLHGSKPSALCFNSKNELYIGDTSKRRVLVYDSQFELIREFGDSNIKKPDSMIIDNDSGTLYVSDYENNQISVWSTHTGMLQTQFKIDSPAQLQINNDFLYVISEGDYDFVKSSGKLRITKGSNCIFILNKQTYQVYDTIKLENWFDCAGLCINKNGNLITTAFELDSDKYVSSHRLLYVFNSNGTLLNKIQMSIDFFSDMIIVDNKKLAFCSYDKFKLLEFE